MMPVTIIHKTSQDNKGSSSKYGFYLNKENQEYIKNNEPEKQQHFFDQHENNISTVKAINQIDENSKGKGLKKKQDRYFTMTLNFSKKELSHIIKKVSGKELNNVNDLNIKEYKKYNEALKNYTRIAMENYAKNFNKNISKDQIVWNAKVEHKRKFKGFEKEVEQGKVKSGELKKGLQSHVHIMVSRMHKEHRVNLSPLANARSSKNLMFKGEASKGGFDRSKLKQENEDSFDKAFKYKRSLEEKFETNRVLKNGTTKEKEEMKTKIIEQKTINNKNEITL